ncbi:hypothetical protein C8R47DRAFT_1080875 [Mycena vitilis]|nr:hypothetical protein C8R47DRAFT_1080875 [Mycena vitilis]
MIVPHGTIDRTGNETTAVSARAGGIVCESVERFEVRDRILAMGCAFSSKRERVDLSTVLLVREASKGRELGTKKGANSNCPPLTQGDQRVVEFQIKFFVQDVARRVATAKIEAAETERDGLGKELAEEKQRSQTSTSLLYLDTTILKNDTPFSVQLQKMPRSKDYKLNCSKVGVVQIPVQAKSRETGDKLEGHRNSLTAMLANFEIWRRVTLVGSGAKSVLREVRRE